jgi:hypothetical protein
LTPPARPYFLLAPAAFFCPEIPPP